MHILTRRQILSLVNLGDSARTRRERHEYPHADGFLREASDYAVRRDALDAFRQGISREQVEYTIDNA